MRCFFEPDAFNPDGSLKSKKEFCINKMGHAMHELDPVFRAFSYAPPIRQLAQSLGYTRPALVQSMYIFKQPRIGAPVDAHQDSTFLFTQPQSVVSAGCLPAVPSCPYAV